MPYFLEKKRKHMFIVPVGLGGIGPIGFGHIGQTSRVVPGLISCSGYVRLCSSCSVSFSSWCRLPIGPSVVLVLVLGGSVGWLVGRIDVRLGDLVRYPRGYGSDTLGGIETRTLCYDCDDIVTGS